MKAEFFEFGMQLPDPNRDRLLENISKRTYSACIECKDYEIIELRQIENEAGTMTDIIVVDCYNVHVPSRNTVGIRPKERLALHFTADRMPAVRALRKDFPRVPHMYYVQLGEPASLCLYVEPWSSLERSWTPEKHFQKILWWLTETAYGRLHRDDQPPEQIFFESPYEVVLPPDVQEKIADESLSLSFTLIEHVPGQSKILRGHFLSKKEAAAAKKINTEVLTILLPAIVHGEIEQFPDTLGQLHAQLERRAAPFISLLRESIRNKTPAAGLDRDAEENCLMIIIVPVKRNENSEPERYEKQGYLINTCLARLGHDTGALTRGDGNRCFYTPIVGSDDNCDKATDWKELRLSPVSVVIETTKEHARIMSAIDPATCAFKGVLAGVGALGGTLADTWAKEAWGEWTFIDHDILKPHNVIRHVGKNRHIGKYKVDVIKEAVEKNYHDGYFIAGAVQDSITSFGHEKVMSALEAADLLVDATTTLDVPRDLSREDKIPRSVSVFLTPSGNGSVVLMEPRDRAVRLSSLEAQYYRAVINSEWGTDHLEGNRGGIWVGAGCRDVSAIISYEIVQLHSAILAQQVRLLSGKSDACIRVWSADLTKGGVGVHEIPVMPTAHAETAGWSVNYDSGIQAKLKKMRQDCGPEETGGVLVGYIDHKLKAIFIVEALPAPSDSEGDKSGFTRGIAGLSEAIDEISRRTAGVVDYIGEWHSHPPFNGPDPSLTDGHLIRTLAETLAMDGQPALIVIVGSDGEISATVKEGR